MATGKKVMATVSETTPLLQTKLKQPRLQE
jgi:hypothetical protein